MIDYIALYTKVYKFVNSENMDLEKYLSENGISKKWFAQKVKIPYRVLINALNNRRGIPIKYFDAVIKMTNGEVSYEDLKNQVMNFKERKIRE